jgi:tripartite-type tricarboxylate transporter receptor subunit TctC
MSTIGFQAVAPALYKNLPYDPDTAFAPVIQTIANQQILVVRNELPVKDVAGLVALARQKPGALTYASAGVGSVLHLAMEYLKFTAGIELRHIPYNGSGKMVVALVAQEVDAAMPDGPSSLSLIQEGRLRAIAVTGPLRAQVLPNVPTIAESGYPGFNVSGWGGVLVPSGTPGPVIAKLNAAIAQVLRTPEAVERMAAEDFQAVAGTPEAFGALIRSERVKWAEVVEKSGTKIE